jgi:hypothetical protein
LALHELRARLAGFDAFRAAVAVIIGTNNLEAKGRGCPEKYIGIWSVVERNCENLTDLARRRGEDGGRSDQLTGRGAAGLKPLDPHRGSVEIDEGLVKRITGWKGWESRRDTGEASDDCIAWRHNRR